MTSPVESFSHISVSTSVIPIDLHAIVHKKHHCRHVLKSKENRYKHKCNKILKKKLKKYKLRLDGGEDEDVLNVSKILITSLTIKSPSSGKDPQKIEGLSDFDELRPKNYLFKMVRRKTSNKNIEYIHSTKNEDIKQDQVTNKNTLDKKQTDAFKLLMDSRNKSIGGNSPGKEKNMNDTEDEEILEKKDIKVKRQLLLQKMAEAKGSLKKKELEEYQEKCIKRKMDKRAENLKKMILTDKKNKKDKAEIKIKDAKKSFTSNIDEEKSEPEKVVKKKKKTLQIVDIFNVIEEPVIVSPEQRQISKEDNEFLNKLSPSLKKKESMLCYFKKLEKDPENTSLDSENHSPIKVKLTKAKNRGKKKLSLNRNERDTNDNMPENNDKNCNVQQIPETDAIIMLGEQNVEKEKNIKLSDRQNRKRNIKVTEGKLNCDSICEPVLLSENRPKRSVKRPIKYNDDAFLTSSDEELHIFTPKKKKHIENIVEDMPTKIKLNNAHDSTKPKERRAMKEKKDELKKTVKLAPIFSKPSQTDPAALEAKQKFLQSGVPDQLKKIIKEHKIVNTLATNFPVVIHVQQIDEKALILSQNHYTIPEKSFDVEAPNMHYEEHSYNNLLNLDDDTTQTKIDYSVKQSVQATLQDIKLLCPKFPVYSTYHYLRSKRKGEFIDVSYLDNSIEIMNGDIDNMTESPEKLNWTNKYKALSTNQIMGNFESIKELKKWLVSWTENKINSKTKATLDSDSSDYYQSDTDSRDSVKSMNNLLILTGPTGSGKTSCVYAVAAELAIKVIEVNVSSRRTGKIMLQELQEATQSHKVNRGKGSLENSQKSQDKYQPETIKIHKRKGSPKKVVGKTVKKSSSTNSDNLNGTPSSQESVRTFMSLILIDDADIVFEQDDGFSSAIVQLVQSSKRPVILVASSLACPHLQKFVQYGKILKMFPLLPRILGPWLDIMCLADSSICWPGLGAKFLNYFKGDIRKTINYLQFYISPYISNSEEEATSQNVDNNKVNIDDENSCKSWADNESEGIKCIAENNIKLETNLIWVDFLNKQCNIVTYSSPAELFNIWWSIPHLLDTASTSTHKTDMIRYKDKSKAVTSLEASANAIDALSLADFYCHKRSIPNRDITYNPWFSSETDSVSEQENFDYYYRSHKHGDEISQELIAGSITRAQKELCCFINTNLQSPGMTQQRQKEKILSRHHSLTSYLSPWTVLDRRAVALDYWPTCRSICRIEKDKTDKNSKRNNRFCHYLKSLSVLCKTDTFDRLADSLCSNSVSEH